MFLDVGKTHKDKFLHPRRESGIDDGLSVNCIRQTEKPTLAPSDIAKGKVRLCVSRRSRCGPDMRNFAKWEPRLPAAPTIRMFTGYA
jgi:hypothetical protein